MAVILLLLHQGSFVYQNHQVDFGDSLLEYHPFWNQLLFGFLFFTMGVQAHQQFRITHCSSRLVKH